MLKRRVAPWPPQSSPCPVARRARDSGLRRRPASNGKDFPKTGKSFPWRGGDLQRHLQHEPRFRVMLTGGASGRRAPLAQGVPSVLWLRPAYQYPPYP
jgi:hypothetical protein